MYLSYATYIRSYIVENTSDVAGVYGLVDISWNVKLPDGEHREVTKTFTNGGVLIYQYTSGNLYDIEDLETELLDASVNMKATFRRVDVYEGIDEYDEYPGNDSNDCYCSFDEYREYLDEFQ
jgi:hypothetical protein